MQWVHGLHFNNLRGDIFGGLTAAVVALPLAMAMGATSGAGPVAGIYGAIFVGFFAALFGGTPAQVSGPTGPMTVVMAAIFTQYTAMFPDNPAQGVALAFTVVIIGGIFQIGFGILKFGKFIELVPHPVVSGFMSGIGVIIILLQLSPLIGGVIIAKPLEAAQAIPELLGKIEYHALALGLLVLVMVYGIPKYLPKLNRVFPSPLFALIAVTLLYLFFMEKGSTPIIGDIPAGFPEFNLPTIESELLFDMLGSGLTLAALGSIDSLLTSLVADNVTRTQHRSDRELIGQGIANTISGFFGGLPGAGATMRTVVNVHAGGRTPLSGALHAVVLLAIMLGVGGLASDIPKAVLAGILIKVGTDIIDWDYFKRLTHIPKSNIAIMVAVFAATVIVDLLIAVGIGMVMTSFLFMHRMSQMQIAGINTVTESASGGYLTDQEAAIIDDAEGKIMLFHLSGPMSFSSAKAMVRRHASAAGYEIMLLDLSDVPVIDFSFSRALEDIILDTLSAGRRIFLVGATGEVQEKLRKFEITNHIKPEKIYQHRIDALLHAKGLLSEIVSIE